MVDVDSEDVVAVPVDAEPTRIVGTRVVTFDVLLTPTRLDVPPLMYRGVFTVSV